MLPLAVTVYSHMMASSHDFDQVINLTDHKSFFWYTKFASSHCTAVSSSLIDRRVSEGTQDRHVGGDSSISFPSFGGTMPLDWLEGVAELECCLQF